MEAADVNVKIVTTQTVDGESETFCTETDGTLYNRTADGFSLVYSVPNEDDFSGETSVTLADGSLTVERGSAMTLTVRPGVRCDADYKTPFGAMPLTVFGKRLEHEFGSDFLYVHAVYGLENNEQTISENDIRLTVQLLYTDSFLL